jgi:hypothetical protein
VVVLVIMVHFGIWLLFHVFHSSLGFGIDYVFCSGCRCAVKHFRVEGCFSIGLWVVSLLPLAYTGRLVVIVGIWHIERDVFFL